LYERHDLLEGERNERGSAGQVPDLLSSRALSNDAGFRGGLSFARPLRHVGGGHAHAPIHELSCMCPSASLAMHAPQCISFHAHALLFSWPSVHVGRNCVQWWKRRLGERNGIFFDGRLLRRDGQNLCRTSDGPNIPRQKIGSWEGPKAHR
jgi:hypothetical protein